MKLLFSFLLLLTIAAGAKGQTVAESQRQAALKYPDLARAGSPLHTRFMALYNAAKKDNPKLLAKPDWPLILADLAAAAPAPEASTSQAAVQSPIAPLPPTTGATLDGFLDIPWGSAPEEAAKKIESRLGVQRRNSGSNNILLAGGEFAGFPVTLWSIQFADQKFHTAKVLFSCPPSDLLDRYRAMQQLLTEKYGAPGTKAFLFDYPYDRNHTGKELTAIRAGKATIGSYWKFPKPDGQPNFIGLAIRESLSIELIYQNGEMIESALKAKKEQSKKDL